MTHVVVKNGRNGNTMIVDPKGRAHTFATIQTEFQDAISRGNAYSINTGLIELTGTGQSALIYLKSNEKEDLVVHELFVQTGTSLNGTVPDIIRTDHFGITGGTIVSAALSAVVVNLNAGSPNELDVTAYKGAEGATTTSLATLSGFFYTASNFVQETGIIIPKGTALVIAATPPPSNESLKIAVTAQVYVKS